jgi:hypothetical protein
MQNMGSGSYGYPRSWDYGGWTWGLIRGCSQPTKIMGDHGGETSHYLVDNGATIFMGEIVSHYFLKSMNEGCALYILVYKYLL